MMVKKTAFIVILIGIISYSCNTTNSDQASRTVNSKEILENSLPIEIGNSRIEVNEKLGVPNRSGDDFESYFEHGLVIDYDDKQIIKSVTASRLISGVTFKGEIFGVSIGDNVTKCTSKWANFESWIETAFEYNIGKWKYNDYTLELEIWSKDGVDSNFGQYKSGTIKQIKLER